VNAIIQVNVQRPGGMNCDKLPSPASKKGVTGVIIMLCIGFRFDDPSGGFSPDQLAPDQRLRAGQRIGLKERSLDLGGHFGRSAFNVQRSTFNVWHHGVEYRANQNPRASALIS
jgi:hypothetical protein